MIASQSAGDATCRRTNSGRQSRPSLRSNVSRDANECTRAGEQRAAQAGMQTPEILKRVLSRVHGVADKVHDVVQPLQRTAFTINDNDNNVHEVAAA